MKPALYWKPLKNGSVKCELCPHNCSIKRDLTGICGARKNLDGKLFTLNHSKPVSIAIDPIEKKPLFHFLPSSSVLSFGTYGCNLSCANCQNYDISMVRDRQPKQEVPPEKIIEMAIANKCSGIAYTYNEPTIYYEYMLDCAKLAREKGLKNIMVSNGYINKEPLKELCKHIDAANIDLKSMSKEFYKTNCKGKLERVKETLKTLAEQNVWLEITTLIIPTLNDSMEEIEELAKWISEELGRDVPLHLSRFFPLYQLESLPPTPDSTLEAARKVAVKHLNYVYIGNVRKLGTEDTICPICGRVLIMRSGFLVKANAVRENLCTFCKQKIPGVFK